MKNNKIISSIILVTIIAIFIVIGIVFNVDNFKLNENTNNVVETPSIINDNIFRVYYLNVGNADCTLLEFNNRTILIDGANEADATLIIKYLIDGFFNTVSPQYAIISAGVHEEWNLPSEDTINALNEVQKIPKIQTLVTKEKGTILIESDGKEVKEPTFIDYDLDGNS